MALNFSSGVRQGMANTSGLKTQFAKGAIFFFTGPQPATADSAPTGTQLGIVTHNAVTFVPGGGANGLNFDTPTLGVLPILSTETWKAVCSAAGTIGWGRLVGNEGTTAASTTLSRIDFSIGTSGADLLLPSVVVISGTPITIDVFEITLPA